MLFIPLSSHHDRKSFNCGNVDLNKWFAEVARQHMEKRVSSTFVAVENSSSTEVFGYYSITLAEIINSELPSHYRKKLPLKVPAFRLGRLAVSVHHQRKGFGELLLFDAIDRITLTASNVGGIGIVVNAKDEAIEFYKQYGFEIMDDHPNNLFLPL